LTNAFSKKLDNHETRIFTYSFQPAASPKALTRISRGVRGWVFHKRGDKSLTELAEMYNPCIRASRRIRL
jgi:RNA-directed DNA polymerase